MSNISEIRVLKHAADIDGLLAGIDQTSYLETIRNSCTSFPATRVEQSSSIDQVYLYARPEYVVAMAIAEGKDPCAALDVWHEAVKGMLSEYRKSRRKSVLFEVVSAMGHCEKKLPLVSANIDLTIATLTVYQSVEIKSTLDELVASSIPLEGWNQPPRLDLADISEKYRLFYKQSQGLEEENSRFKKELGQQKELLSQFEVDQEKLSAINKDVSEENQLLLLQLHQVQEELERVYLKGEQQSEDSVQLRAELEDASKAKKALTSENQKLRDQVNRQQEESSRFKGELDQKNKSLAEIESRHEKLNGESKDLREENELLLLQLHQVQEELEQYYLKLKAVSAKGEKNDLQQADSEPKPPTPVRSVKQKNRSAFVRKIAALKRLRSEAALLKSSHLFDGAWYLQSYPDVAAAKMDPARHYLRFGAAEGRNPGPDFNTEWYLRQYPDVSESGLNALVHYLKYGKNENRMKSGWSWN